MAVLFHFSRWLSKVYFWKEILFIFTLEIIIDSVICMKTAIYCMTIEQAKSPKILRSKLTTGSF